MENGAVIRAGAKIIIKIITNLGIDIRVTVYRKCSVAIKKCYYFHIFLIAR